MTETAIVILNWNGVHFLEQFLPSVTQYAKSAEVVIIDNASTDSSLQFLSANYPKIKTICLDENYGFAEGYNRGLEQVHAEYYILLNSDIEVMHNWWQPLVNLLKSDTKIAAVQPKIKSFHQRELFEYAGACGGFLDKFGYPFCRGRILDTIEQDLGQYNTQIQVFWASGAAMAVKAEVFQQMNGFDGDFFAHMEEIDLCWRMQNAGYTIYCEPKSEVYHVGGGTLPNESPFKLYLNFRNNLFMLYKNLPSKLFVLTLFLRMCLDGVATLKYLTDGNLKAANSVWKAHIHFYKALPKLKIKRKLLGWQKQTDAKRYDKSILWQYFIKKSSTFSSIK